MSLKSMRVTRHLKHRNGCLPSHELSKGAERRTRRKWRGEYAGPMSVVALWQRMGESSGLDDGPAATCDSEPQRNGPNGCGLHGLDGPGGNATRGT